MNYKNLQKFIKKNRDFFEIKVIGKSVLNKNIYAINKVFDPKNEWALLTGGIHAREHLSCDFLCHYIEKLKSIPFLEYNISFVPLINPDGADFAVNGIDKYDDKIKERLITINGREDFTMYKANANGVDLNNNWDADFSKNFSRKKSPSSQGFYGYYPMSEPEVRALEEWTYILSPFITLSFHLKGEEIYYDFFQKRKRKKRDGEIAKLFAGSTGYKIRSTQNISSGGYKDWCVSNLKIPSLTIELGEDRFSHPYPKEELDNICAKHKCLFENLAKSYEIVKKYR